ALTSYHLYLEAFLTLWLFWLIRQRKKAEKKQRLIQEEKQLIINAWQPKPLVNDEVTNMENYDNGVIWGPVTLDFLVLTVKHEGLLVEINLA
ncbi:unnamed protein product, partial [Orchesella dallaii]